MNLSFPTSYSSFASTWTVLGIFIFQLTFWGPNLRSQETSRTESSDWVIQEVPQSWRSVPQGKLAPIDGYSWYRVAVFIPMHWKEVELTLHVEALDDARSAWINGEVVGATGTFPPQFRSGLGEKGRYPIDPSLVRPGEFNIVAIRVYQSDPRPNFSVAPPVLMNESAKEAIRLEGGWQYRPGDQVAWAKADLSEFGKMDANESVERLAKSGLFRRVDHVEDADKYVSRREGDTDPLSPKEAVKHFVTPEDLRVELALADPDIAQPLFMTWDERGRLWVVEYRQYPEPAGLTMLSRDAFLRSVYDKVPPAPPNHFPGKDRITIHEDTDGDGTYDLHKTFVDGLSLASSVAIGRGGVYVTNAPYLLFYPDRDGNDVPDRDPDVLLEGFGIEDSHAVINSLRFGPDGWLYGAQGSTVSASVRKPKSPNTELTSSSPEPPPIKTVGQLIWRYHPESQRFEVFAEGGGNTFGCEIDSKGRVYSGHNGGDTRGFHYVQGGYYRKGFGKHGPLSNPFAFGFFENMKHHNAARFTHNFILYEESTLPERYRGKLFGIEPLQGQVVLSDFQPFQSSFETKDLERVVKTDDPWFRPVDIKAGPDGCIYIADMYEQRIDHSSHYAGRVDRTNGRIYRLRPSNEFSRFRSPAVAKNATDVERALVEGLKHPDRWKRQTSLRLLGDLKNAPLREKLERLTLESEGQDALEGLWGLNAVGGFNRGNSLRLIQHQDPYVRSWTIRLLTDQNLVDEANAKIWSALATQDPSIEVRKQLASSAKRLRAEYALPILAKLAARDEDAGDIHQPLLIWWGLEAHIASQDPSSLIQKILTSREAWHQPFMAGTLLERWMKRYALSGNRVDLESAAKLLSAAPDRESANRLLKGFEEAFQGRSLAGIPDSLAAAIEASGGGSLPLRLRQGNPQAIQESITLLNDPKGDKTLKRVLIETMGQSPKEEYLAILLVIMNDGKDPVLVTAALGALQPFENPSVEQAILSKFHQLPVEGQLSAESLLSSRLASSLALLKGVESNQIPKEKISIATVRRMLLHHSPELEKRIEALWGKVSGASTAEMVSETNRIQEILRQGSGNPKRGKVQFTQHCGRCHRLFEEGGGIGPDLTPFARDNTERMLVNIINPNLEIREGFENYLVSTSDGRVLTGFVVEKDQQVVIVRGADGQNRIVRQSEIEVMKAIPQSVMPESTLKPLDDQQLRDLFAYLRSSQPVN